MDYKEALEYIHSVSWCFCKPGLERIEELCRRMGNPERDLKFIHVAGTNGKGSFCSMTASVLTRCGYKTGLYTSPYIRYFNERMCIDGVPISNEELAELTEYVKPIAESMTDKPTEFELITAIAFEYFKRHGCDIVVLEAGMGGRLDSTNIIDGSVLSVITGIALDHTAFLGDTVEKIAAEKAGIIKSGCPVLYGGEDDAAAEVIAAVAEARGSEYFRVDYSRLRLRHAELDGTYFDFGEHKDIYIALLGLYQPRNASVVLTAVDILRKRGMELPETAVREGLASARWQARFEIINKEPLTVFDGAHNPQGIDSAVEGIKHYFGERRVYILTGVLADKDYGYIAEKLAQVALRAFVITPNSPRALAADSYAEVLRADGISAESYPDLTSAYAAATKAALRDGVPLVCLGSLYIYSELMDVLTFSFKKEKSKQKEN